MQGSRRFMREKCVVRVNRDRDSGSGNSSVNKTGVIGEGASHLLVSVVE